MPPNEVPIRHVINDSSTPPPRKMHLAVATLKDGEKFEVLYVGSSHTEALAAGREFDAERFERIDVFRAPTAFRRFTAPSEEIVHHTPLKPGMTMEDLKKGRIVAKPKAGTPDVTMPQPEVTDETKTAEPSDELVKREQAAQLAVQTREKELATLSDGDLKAAAVAKGVSLEGLQELLDAEEREDLILAILEKEFPKPVSTVAQQPANRLGGLGR